MCLFDKNCKVSLKTTRSKPESLRNADFFNYDNLVVRGIKEKKYTNFLKSRPVLFARFAL